MKKKLLILLNGSLSEEKLLIKQCGLSVNPKVIYDAADLTKTIAEFKPDAILIDAKTAIANHIKSFSEHQSKFGNIPFYVLAESNERAYLMQKVGIREANLTDLSSLPELLSPLSNERAENATSQPSFHGLSEHAKTLLPFFVENISDTIFAINCDGTFLFTNKAFEKNLGYDLEEILSLNIYQLIHADDLEKAKQLFSISASDNSAGLRLRFRHKVGTWHSLSLFVTKQGNNGDTHLFCLAKDVTEKQGKLALHKIFHEKSRELEEENTVFIIIDTQYQVKKYNEAAKDWFRKLNGHVLREGEKIEDVLPYDVLGRLSKRIDCVLKGETIIYEKKINVPNTGNLWFELAYTPIFDEQKEVVGVVIAFKDLMTTGEHTMQDEDSEQFFKTLIQFAPDITAVVNEHGILQYVSTSSISEMGFLPEELKGKNLVEFIHPDDQYVFENTLANAQFEYEQSINIDIRLKHKNTSWIHLDATIKQFWFSKHNEMHFLIYAQNITERKQVEDALKLHVSAIEASQNGVMIVDALLEDSPIIYVNPRFEAITGYEGCEIMGLNPRFLHRDDGSQSDLEQVRNAMRYGKPCTVLLKNYKKDGSLFWNELTISPIYDNDGSLTHFVGTANDVSERILSNEKLNKSNDILKAISEIQSVFISESAPKDLFEHLLNRMLSLTKSQFGFIGEMIEQAGEQELVIRSVSDEKKIRQIELVDFHGNACSMLPNLCNKVIETGKPIIENQLRMNLHKKHNVPEQHPMINTFIGMPLISGEKVIGVAGVSNRRGGYDQQVVDYLAPFLSTCASIIQAQRQNIWRKKAEEKLREQAALLDITEEAIIVYDENDTVLYWNNGAVKMYGWSRSEIIGKNAGDFLNALDKEAVFKAKAAVSETGHWIGEFTHTTKSGKEIIVASRWNSMPPSKHGQESKPILILNTDITNKKKFESHLLRAQRLESLGRLVSGIAHDLNNILSPILLSLQLLKRKTADEKTKSLINTLELSAKRGGNLVKQVLSFAKGVECERVPIKIEHSVQEVEKILFETFPKTIDIDIFYNKPLWYVHGDSTQLHQVLLNLCVNARDAMHPFNSGTLRINISNATVSEVEAAIYPDAHAGRYVKVSVSDTGTGIAPEHLDSIYEPFFTTKDPGQGTGLGLSTVFMIVKSHQGFISVYSELNKGTTFNVFLPAFDSDEAEVEPLDSCLQIQGVGEQILVIDDEAPVREVTQAALSDNGYDVITACDGQDGLEKIHNAQEKISAAIIDMMMPKLDGPTTIKQIRQTHPEIKIIAVSGLFSYKKILMESGETIDAFLQKPYTSEQLLGTLHDLLHEQNVY